MGRGFVLVTRVATVSGTAVVATVAVGRELDACLDGDCFDGARVDLGRTVLLEVGGRVVVARGTDVSEATGVAVSEATGLDEGVDDGGDDEGTDDLADTVSGESIRSGSSDVDEPTPANTSEEFTVESVVMPVVTSESSVARESIDADGIAPTAEADNPDDSDVTGGTIIVTVGSPTRCATIETAAQPIEVASTVPNTHVNATIRAFFTPK